MYSLLPFSLQSAVAQEYPHVNEKELEQFLRCLTFYRNVCAHNECLYCFSSRRDIPDTNLHRKLNIPKTGTQYWAGKSLSFVLSQFHPITWKAKLIIQLLLRESGAFFLICANEANKAFFEFLKAIVREKIAEGYN